MLMKAEDMRGLGAGLLHRSALLPVLAPGVPTVDIHGKARSVNRMNLLCLTQYGRGVTVHETVMGGAW